MLIRPRGASAGIAEYLRTGQKADRELSRDELDKRVTLHGDLDITDSIIESIGRDGQAYIHLTLSFYEDEITSETLQAIVAEFKEFAFSAFKDEEINWYAEAHLPKVTEYIDRKTGEAIKRKPHIHIVIPKINLLSGQDMHPLGYEKHNVQFIDAFQEHINNKFGLVSPKDRPRLGSAHGAEILARTKGDFNIANVFSGKGAEIRKAILDEVIKQNIVSIEDFKQSLSQFGAVKETNGKEGFYLSVKPNGSDKFIRLKDGEFSPEFIALSTVDKVNRLNAIAETTRVEAGVARPTPEHIAERLNEWHELRAKEVRFINSGNSKFYKAYKDSSREEKLQILAERESAFYNKYLIGENDGSNTRTPADHLRSAEQDLRTASHHIGATVATFGGHDAAARNVLDRTNSRAIAAAIVRCIGDQKHPATTVETQQQRLHTAGEKIIDNPKIVLDGLTRSQSVFKWSDIERYVMRNTSSPEQFKAAFEAVMNAPELTVKTHNGQERFSTHEIVNLETRLLATTDKLSASKTKSLSDATKYDTARSRSFNAGQADAFNLLTGDERIAIVNGAAGTGKSYVLAAMREAYEAEGYQLHGAILQGKTAEDLERDSGIKSQTMHSFLSALESGKERLSKKSVVVVDEAGMIGSRQMEKLLAHVDRAGARLRLVGDAKQLHAVDFGNAFQVMIDRVNSTGLTEIKRQSSVWQQKASEALSRHEIDKGIAAYVAHGDVLQHATQQAAKLAIVKQWGEDRKLNPSKSQIVITHTNAERRELNRLMRAQLIEQGALGEGVTVRAASGLLPLAINEQIMFLKNDYDSLKVKNGTAGTVKQINGEKIVVELMDGRMVTVDLNKYTDIDHGYAMTVYKTQGMTVDRAYMLASKSMSAENAYVGMTRHREELQVHFSTEQFKNTQALSKSLSQADVKEFSVETLSAGVMPSIAMKENGDSVVSQLITDALDRKSQDRAASLDEWSDIRKNLDASRLLARLSKTHGIKPEEFQITKGQDGWDRIQYGTKNLNVSDFLTKTANLSWEEAQPILRAAYAEQKAGNPAEARQPIKTSLWADFQVWKGSEWQKEKQTSWEAQKQAESGRKTHIKTAFAESSRNIEKQIDPRNYAERRAALSVLRMERIQKEGAARENIKQEREQLKEKLNLRSADLYRLWLSRKAGKGDARALAELRRQQVTLPKPNPDECALVATGIKPNDTAILATKNDRVSYSVGINGAVTYKRDGKDFLRDESRSIVVINTEKANIDTALRLGMQKFGSTLNITGSEEFKRKVVEVAVEKGLRIDFKNEELNVYKLHLEDQKQIKPVVTPQAAPQVKEQNNVNKSESTREPVNDLLASVANKRKAWQQEKQTDLEKRQRAEQRREPEPKPTPKGHDYEPGF